MDQGPQLSVLVAHCNRSVIECAGKRITLFPKTAESLVCAARQVGLRIELLIADWPAEPGQLAPLARWLPRILGKTPCRVHDLFGAFNKGAAINLLAGMAACENLFFLDCDMIVPAEVLRRGHEYLSQGKAWFPGYQAFSRGGKLSLPSTPRHGTGNAFLLRSHLQEYGGWPSKETWGQFDRPLSDWAVKRGISAEDLDTRKPVPGFHHLWHPRHHGWNGKGRG